MNSNFQLNGFPLNSTHPFKAGKTACSPMMMNPNPYQSLFPITNHLAALQNAYSQFAGYSLYPTFPNQDRQTSPQSDGSPSAKRIRYDVCPACHTTLEDTQSWREHECQTKDTVDSLLTSVSKYRSQMQMERTRSDIFKDHKHRDRAQRITSLQLKLQTRNSGYMKSEASSRSQLKSETSPSTSKEATCSRASSRTSTTTNHRLYSCKYCQNCANLYKMNPECGDVLCQQCWENAHLLQPDNQDCKVKLCPFCEHQFQPSTLINCQL